VNRSSPRSRSALAVTALLGTFAGVLAAGGAAVAGQAAEPPRNTARPSIAGIPRERQTLTASPGTWTGTAPIRYAYQWVRCSAQLSNCSTVRGRTSRSYALGAGDVGRRLIVVVTATNSAGGATADATTETIGPRGTAPRNTAPPTITGTAVGGQTLTAANGTWSGTSVSYAYRWLRCDAQGNACAAIGGATRSTYVLGSPDVGNTIRVSVRGWNAFGAADATSAQTAVVAPPGPAGQIALPGGGVSIPVASVGPPDRLIVDRVTFSPNPVRSRAPFQVTFRVVDTRGFAVREALVYVRSTPLVTSTPPEQATGLDGTVTLQLVPRPSFPLARGRNVQFFVRARKLGENVLAGVSTRRLVQVRTAAPAR
jgi:hypothetical protein